MGTAVDGEGNVFFSDHHDNVIPKVDRKGKITTLAGTEELMSTREKGPATKVIHNQPWGLFLDDDADVLYIADTFSHRIRTLRLESS